MDLLSTVTKQIPQPKIEILRPQLGRQEQFCSSSADITIYGGSAGGGKTYAILLEPLRHIHNSKFGAVIFRRTYPEITNEGSLWDESQNIYSRIGGKPNLSDLYWKFPSGAKITFSHMQTEADKERWKSSQIPLIEFDQLEMFTESQFFYMLSRNRSLCGVRPYIRATCNPEPGWLADFLSWWIAEDGYADLDRAGRIRWVIRSADDSLIWSDTKEELLSIIRSKGIAVTDDEPKSVTFIPATIYDNQILLQRDPSYVSNLKLLPMVDRMRLLGDPQRGGNWKIKPSAGKVFNRGWFDIVDTVPRGGIEVRYWDFAGTSKKALKHDPDYSAGVSIRLVDGIYYVTDMVAEQWAPTEVDRQSDLIIRQDVERCRLSGTRYMVRWEVEPGSASLRDNVARVQRLAGLDAKGLRKREDKLSSWKAFATQAEIGMVKILKNGIWNGRFLENLHAVPDAPHDDIADAASGAFNELVQNTLYRSARSKEG